MPLALKPSSKLFISFLIAAVMLISFAPVVQAAGTQADTPAQPSTSFCQDAGTCITGLVYLIPAISADAAFVVAYVFDLMIKLSLDSSGYAIDFLSSGWNVALSLANIAILFILLYIAITILFQAETAGTMRMLATLIVVALLVNFSFLITRIVIDGGNILGVEFYNAIQAPTFQAEGGAAKNLTGIGSGVVGSPASDSVKDLTEPIMGVIGIQNVLNGDDFQRWKSLQENAGAAGMVTEIITLSTLFIAVAAAYWVFIFAFTSAALKFLIRTVVLWFILMLAPLAFAARALKGSGLYDQWQKTLITYTIYPAAFLFMFYILAITAHNISTCTTSAGATCSISADIFNTSNSLIFTLAVLAIRVGIVIAMLYFGLNAVDNMAKIGNKWVHGIAGKVQGTVQGWATTLPRSIGRGVVSGVKSGANEAYHGSVGLGLQHIDDKFRTSEFGNSRFGYALRQQTTKPLMDHNVLGMESRNQFLNRTKKETQDKNRNLRDGANRDAIIRAGETRGMGKQADKEDVDRIQQFSTKDMETMQRVAGSKALTDVASFFTEKQIKDIDKNDALAKELKEQLIKTWNTRNAPPSETKEEQRLAEIEKIEQQRQTTLKERATADAVRREQKQAWETAQQTAQQNGVPVSEIQVNAYKALEQKWKEEDAKRIQEDIEFHQGKDFTTLQAEKTALQQQLQNRSNTLQVQGSPEAPINKADKLIEKLDELQQKLVLSVDKIPLEIKNGNRVTQKTVADALSKSQSNVREYELMLDSIQKNPGTQKADIVTAKTNLRDAKEINNTLQQLQATMEKIPLYTSRFTGEQRKGEIEIIKH